MNLEAGNGLATHVECATRLSKFLSEGIKRCELTQAATLVKLLIDIYGKEIIAPFSLRFVRIFSIIPFSLRIIRIVLPFEMLVIHTVNINAQIY